MDLIKQFFNTVLLDSYSMEVNPVLGQFIFIGLILFFGGGGIWVLITLEQRVEKYIQKKSKLKGYELLSLRKPRPSDGANPFGNVDVWIGTSSTIFGFSGEKTFNRIVRCKAKNNELEFWVKVRTSVFIPFSIQWKKIIIQ